MSPHSRQENIFFFVRKEVCDDELVILFYTNKNISVYCCQVCALSLFVYCLSWFPVHLCGSFERWKSHRCRGKKVFRNISKLAHLLLSLGEELATLDRLRKCMHTWTYGIPSTLCDRFVAQTIIDYAFYLSFNSERASYTHTHSQHFLFAPQSFSNSTPKMVAAFYSPSKKTR